MAWARKTRPWPKVVSYALYGILLALGAPGGLLLLKFILAGAPVSPTWLSQEVAAERLVYGYLLCSTTVVFVGLGVLLGKKEDRLQRESVTDPLTGLHNRRYFHERLCQEIARAERYETPLSLALIDVDRLKQINDTKGHDAGDVALCTVALALRQSCRKTDLVARFGGDEFALLAPATSAVDTAELATRVHAALREQGRARPRLPTLTVSIGIADLDTSEPEAVTLYRAADGALYQAKAAGRNRTACAAFGDAQSSAVSLPVPGAQSSGRKSG